MELLDPRLEKYAEEHTTGESPLLRELVEFSENNLEYTDMLSGPVVGRLLAMLVKMTGSCRVLEIGTFTGYSALSMAEALPADGALITCEYNERYEAVARRFFDKSEHGHKITLKMGRALDTLNELEGVFDLVFLDADKVSYPAYYEQLVPMLSDGGILVVDNVFWSGGVLDPADEKELAIDRLNRMIAEDTQVEQVMLSVRDGLTIARKR